MNALPNVVVRYSSDDINGSLDIFDIKENKITFKYSSTIIPKIDFDTTASVCPSSKQQGKCLDCRKCWSKDIESIAYVLH